MIDGNMAEEKAKRAQKEEAKGESPGWISSARTSTSATMAMAAVVPGWAETLGKADRRLFAALERGDEKAARKALRGGFRLADLLPIPPLEDEEREANPNARKDGISALRLAASRGLGMAVRELLEAGADPGERGPDGKAVFRMLDGLIEEAGDSEEAERLSKARMAMALWLNGPMRWKAPLEMGKAAGRETARSCGRLQAAAFGGNREEIARLLAAGADPDARTAMAGPTALHMAALAGHWDAAADLVKAGAEVDAKWLREGESGKDMWAERSVERTALRIAAEAGDREGVQALLGWGADPLEERRTRTKEGLEESKLASRLATGEIGEILREAEDRAKRGMPPARRLEREPLSEEDLARRIEELEASLEIAKEKLREARRGAEEPGREPEGKATSAARARRG